MYQMSASENINKQLEEVTGVGKYVRKMSDGCGKMHQKDDRIMNEVFINKEILVIHDIIAQKYYIKLNLTD